MKKDELVSKIAGVAGITRKQAAAAVDAFCTEVGNVMRSGDKLTLTGFGTFEAKKKMERVIINPSTGQRMLVPPKLVLNFKPNQTWKDKLKGGQ